MKVSIYIWIMFSNSVRLYLSYKFRRKFVCACYFVCSLITYEGDDGADVPGRFERNLVSYNPTDRNVGA